MEIVKDSNKIYKCPICGCEVKITKISDVHYGFIRFEDTGLFFKKELNGSYLICPKCCNKIIISIDK